MERRTWPEHPYQRNLAVRRAIAGSTTAPTASGGRGTCGEIKSDKLPRRYTARRNGFDCGENENLLDEGEGLRVVDCDVVVDGLGV
eukprot:1064560-Rhodomonas_salina.2